MRRFAGCYLPVICQWLCKTSFTHFQFHYLHHVLFILSMISKPSIFSCNLQWNPAPKNNEMALCPANVICHVICHRGYLPYLPYTATACLHLMFPALPWCFHLCFLTVTGVV